MIASRPILRLPRLWLCSVLAAAAAMTGCGPAPDPGKRRVRTTDDSDSASLTIDSPKFNHAEAAGWEVNRPWRDWKYIVLHHSATKAGSVESIHAQHAKRRDAQGNPWRGIGYHFVIGNGQGMPDGGIEPTFRWDEQDAGAHAGTRLHNEAGIGICLVGDFNKTPPTELQHTAVRRLVRMLQEQFAIPASHVLPHSQLKPTKCPGRLFDWTDVASTRAAPVDSSVVTVED
jgi:hypothetical protein